MGPFHLTGCQWSGEKSAKGGDGLKGTGRVVKAGLVTDGPMSKPRKSSPASRSSRPTTTTRRWRSPVRVPPDTRSSYAKWPATHERTARAGGALFSPRVRPALRRADPVARRAPARLRPRRRSSRARAGPGNLVAARRARRPGRLALPHRPQPGDRRPAAGANPRPGHVALTPRRSPPSRRRRTGSVAA
jgi:hypothetical protein